MLKGKTKSGINFEIDERIKDDTRFLQYVVELQNEDDDLLRQKALYDLLGLVFGGRKGVIAFQNTVASVNDGCCTSEVLLKELNEIFEALNVKKS